MMVLGCFILSYENIPHAQKAQNVQKAQGVKQAASSS